MSTFLTIFFMQSVSRKSEWSLKCNMCVHIFIYIHHPHKSENNRKGALTFAHTCPYASLCVTLVTRANKRRFLKMGTHAVTRTRPLSTSAVAKRLAGWLISLVGSISQTIVGHISPAGKEGECEENYGLNQPQRKFESELLVLLAKSFAFFCDWYKTFCHYRW